jgi:hypothetical protein
MCGCGFSSASMRLQWARWLGESFSLMLCDAVFYVVVFGRASVDKSNNDTWGVGVGEMHSNLCMNLKRSADSQAICA